MVLCFIKKILPTVTVGHHIMFRWRGRNNRPHDWRRVFV